MQIQAVVSHFQRVPDAVDVLNRCGDDVWGHIAQFLSPHECGTYERGKKHMTQLGSLALVNRYCRDVVRAVKAHMVTFPHMKTIAKVEAALRGAARDASITRVALSPAVVANFWTKSFDERIHFLRLLSDKFGPPEYSLDLTGINLNLKSDGLPDMPVDYYERYPHARITMLELAAHQGSVEHARCLLRLGAKMDQDNSRWPAWEYAALQGYLEVVKLFLDYGLSANATNTLSCSILEAAVWSGRSEVVELLLSRGAIMRPCSGSFSRTLLECARQQHPTNTKLIALLKRAEQSQKAS